MNRLVDFGASPFLLNYTWNSTPTEAALIPDGKVCVVVGREG